jgi:hypothetical protein
MADNSVVEDAQQGTDFDAIVNAKKVATPEEMAKAQQKMATDYGKMTLEKASKIDPSVHNVVGGFATAIRETSNIEPASNVAPAQTAIEVNKIEVNTGLEATPNISTTKSMQSGLPRTPITGNEPYIKPVANLSGINPALQKDLTYGGTPTTPTTGKPIS